MRPERMTFGVFLPPFHRPGENPTLAMQREMELIEWLDELGYDEAWIGEHHSAGWEIIADPALMIAALGERTRHIRLGAGVVSLPYHHPLMVVDRFVQLDHMTRGRAMLGVGPGTLVSDAHMMGIEPTTQRPRMEEALGVIMRLLAGEMVDHTSDWFELRSARLPLLPYTRPHFPIAVASMMTPAGAAPGSSVEMIDHHRPLGSSMPRRSCGPGSGEARCPSSVGTRRAGAGAGRSGRGPAPTARLRRAVIGWPRRCGRRQRDPDARTTSQSGRRRGASGHLES